MDNPEYCIVQPLPGLDGFTAVSYLFFAASREAYAIRRKLIEQNKPHTFGKYDPAIHEAAWKASLPKIEIAT